MPKYKIYCDNKVEGFWFKGLTAHFSGATLHSIGRRGSNPSHVDDLIRYDRPDIILLAGEKPVMVVEKTREVPTGHNVGQRIARLVRAVESGVLTIKYFPFDARKHGSYTAVCNLNIRLLEAFTAMTRIHGVPILAVNWPMDKNGELVDDGTEDDRIKAVVGDYLGTGHKNNCGEILAQQRIMEDEYKARLARRGAYARPPGSIVMVSSISLGDYIDGTLQKEIRTRFMARPKTLLYQIGMTPESCKRQDPYTGMQFIYDYLLCRDGADPGDKHTNLVLHFPLLTRKKWYENNPNNPSTKSCNWYITANGFLFKDGLDLIR